MKRMLLISALLLPTAWTTATFGAGTGGATATTKPDCSAKQKALDDAKTATKASKADLSSCAEKKGKEKAACEKPLKDKAKTEMTDLKEKEKSAKKDVDCCQNPKMKGCPS